MVAQPFLGAAFRVSLLCQLGLWPRLRLVLQAEFPFLSLRQEQTFAGKVTLRQEPGNALQMCDLILGMMLYKTLFPHDSSCADLQGSPLKITAVTWINWLGKIFPLSRGPQQSQKMWPPLHTEARRLHVALQTDARIRGSAVTALLSQEEKPARLQGSQTVARQILIYLTASVIK